MGTTPCHNCLCELTLTRCRDKQNMLLLRRAESLCEDALWLQDAAADEIFVPASHPT
jgi:hypothetical protein